MTAARWLSRRLRTAQRAIPSQGGGGQEDARLDEVRHSAAPEGRGGGGACYSTTIMMLARPLVEQCCRGLQEVVARMVVSKKSALGSFPLPCGFA